jgi:hypothetical protein
MEEFIDLLGYLALQNLNIVLSSTILSNTILERKSLLIFSPTSLTSATSPSGTLISSLVMPSSNGRAY